MMPGMPEKRTHDYIRHRTTTLFAAPQNPDHQELAAGAPRLTHAFTPTYSSWLNQVERFSDSSPNTSCAAANTAASRPSKPTSANWVKAWNENPTPFTGTKTAEETLESNRQTSEASFRRRTRGWQETRRWSLSAPAPALPSPRGRAASPTRRRAGIPDGIRRSAAVQRARTELSAIGFRSTPRTSPPGSGSKLLRGSFWTDFHN
jgi:hypothetical protein